MADLRALALLSDTDSPLMGTKSEYWKRYAERMTEAVTRADNNRGTIDARSHLLFYCTFCIFLYILFVIIGLISLLVSQSVGVP
jgi:hypothetical protein